MFQATVLGMALPYRSMRLVELGVSRASKAYSSLRKRPASKLSAPSPSLPLLICLSSRLPRQSKGTRLAAHTLICAHHVHTGKSCARGESLEVAPGSAAAASKAEAAG